VAILLKLIKEYRFKGNISYFIGDNAELNNIYIDAVLQVLYLKILVKK
jgi:hypothetical protein